MAAGILNDLNIVSAVIFTSILIYLKKRAWCVIYKNGVKAKACQEY